MTKLLTASAPTRGRLGYSGGNIAEASSSVRSGKQRKRADPPPLSAAPSAMAPQPTPAAGVVSTVLARIRCAMVAPSEPFSAQNASTSRDTTRVPREMSTVEPIPQHDDAWKTAHALTTTSGALRYWGYAPRGALIAPHAKPAWARSVPELSRGTSAAFSQEDIMMAGHVNSACAAGENTIVAIHRRAARSNIVLHVGSLVCVDGAGNVAWSRDVPGPFATHSMAVAGTTLFTTSGRSLIGLDVKTGALLFESELPALPKRSGSWLSRTTSNMLDISDGKGVPYAQILGASDHVYVVSGRSELNQNSCSQFDANLLLCFSSRGGLRYERPFHGQFDVGSTHFDPRRGRVIVQRDPHLIAFDLKSAQELWRLEVRANDSTSVDRSGALYVSGNNDKEPYSVVTKWDTRRNAQWTTRIDELLERAPLSYGSDLRREGIHATSEMPRALYIEKMAAGRSSLVVRCAALVGETQATIVGALNLAGDPLWWTYAPTVAFNRPSILIDADGSVRIPGLSIS